jgi:putative oxidoreductase
MRYIVPVGRVLFSLIFIMSYPAHFSHQGPAYAAQHGVPMASILVPIAGILAVGGGLSVALGYRANLGAIALVLFLVPVTLIMHNFWAVRDPVAAQMQHGNFMKNLSMLGGALIIAYFGSGPLSLDAWLQSRKAQPK